MVPQAETPAEAAVGPADSEPELDFLSRLEPPIQSRLVLAGQIMEPGPTGRKDLIRYFQASRPQAVVTAVEIARPVAAADLAVAEAERLTAEPETKAAIHRQREQTAEPHPLEATELLAEAAVHLQAARVDRQGLEETEPRPRFPDRLSHTLVVVEAALVLTDLLEQQEPEAAVMAVR